MRELANHSLPHDIRFIKQSANLGDGVPAFSIMRDENYFLPHFLAHYRNLGISNFVIFADRCDDEFMTLLRNEHDVSIMCSASLKYSDTFGFQESGSPKRLVQYIKEIISNSFFANRWHLVADADEFLVLPSPFRDIPSYTRWLEQHDINCSFASMIDFYPRTLQGRNFPVSQSPFQAAPYFDRGPYHALDSAGTIVTQSDGIRGRLLRYLESAYKAEMMQLGILGYVGGTNYKFPLMRTTDAIKRRGCHRVGGRTKIHRSALAHFKFYPGLDAKIQNATKEGNYWRSSTEYKFLGLAISKIENVDLVFEESAVYTTPGDLFGPRM